LKTQVGEQVKGKLLEKLGVPAAASGASGVNSTEAAKDAARDKLKEKLLKGLLK
jgi:hypothetical protein